MPPPAVSLRLRKLRRRFGIAAPRVVVRSHVSWQWYAALGVLLFLLALVFAWSVMQRNETGAMGREVESLRVRLAEQDKELEALRATAGTGLNAMSIERAAQQQLLARVQGLERENAALKEDILLFERLIPVVGEEAVVRVENFRVVDDGAGRFRYRLLLAFQPGKQSPEFRGRLQLAIVFMQDGRELQIFVPEKRDATGEYQLELKHFLRREGVFSLPPRGVLKAVEARVLQGDTLKAKRLAQL